MVEQEGAGFAFKPQGGSGPVFLRADAIRHHFV